MHPHFLYLFLYIAAIYLLGFFFLIVFWRRLFEKHDLFINIGLAWGLGNFAAFVWLFVLAFFNQLNLVTPGNLLVLTTGLILLLALTMIRKRREIFSFRKTNWLVLAGFIWFFFPFLYSSLFSYLIDWDAVAIWFFKAKAFFYAENVWRAPYFQDLAAFRYAHKAYPPALPLVIAGYYKLIGTVNDQAILLYPALFFFNLVLIAYGFMREMVKKLSSLMLAILTVSILTFPYLVIYGRNGYADVPLGFIFTLCLILLIYGLETNSRDEKLAYGGLILILAALSAMIKNEGVPFLAIISLIYSGVLFLAQNQPKEQFSPKRTLAAATLFILALLPILLWQYFKLVNHIAVDSYLDRAQIYSNMLTRFKFIFNLYLNEIIDTSKFGALLIPSFFLFVISSTFLIAARKIRFLLPALVLTAQLGVYTFIYAVTNVPLDWQVLTSFDRLLLHLIPGFFTALAYQLPPTVAVIENLLKKKNISE